MILAVASGKGGTGKTTVAVNLALTVPGPVCLLDCDVEEPNCHIFMKPEIRSRETVGVPVPVVDEAKCNACGECGRICQYHAIVAFKTKPLVFPELCHGCGGCAKVCLTGAIAEADREVGVVEAGKRGEIEFVQGRLNVGHPMSPPLIRAVKRHARANGLTIIDCPPGTSCPVIAAVRGSDCVILVTEPTPFGQHDMARVLSLARHFNIPAFVCVNKWDINPAVAADIERQANSAGAGVAGRIRYDRAVTSAQVSAQTVVEYDGPAAEDIKELWEHILREGA